MDQSNNFVNPEYQEGTPNSSGNIVSTYTIEETDTLPAIAKKFGLTVADLVKVNGETLGSADKALHPGTKINIPNIEHGDTRQSEERG